MAEHTVYGVRVNAVAAIRAYGVKFHLHRPVEKDGQRRRKGWMLSHDGFYMAVTDEMPEEDAKKEFTDKLIETFSNAKDLKAAIAEQIERVKSGESWPRVVW